MEANSVMTAKDIANELHVGLNFIYKQLKTGKIPAVRIGDRYFLSRSAFEKFLSGEKSQPVAKG